MMLGRVGTIKFLQLEHDDWALAIERMLQEKTGNFSKISLIAKYLMLILTSSFCLFLLSNLKTQLFPNKIGSDSGYIGIKFHSAPATFLHGSNTCYSSQSQSSCCQVTVTPHCDMCLLTKYCFNFTPDPSYSWMKWIIYSAGVERSLCSC